MHRLAVVGCCEDGKCPLNVYQVAMGDKVLISYKSRYQADAYLAGYQGKSWDESWVAVGNAVRCTEIRDAWELGMAEGITEEVIQEERGNRDA